MTREQLVREWVAERLDRPNEIVQALLAPRTETIVMFRAYAAAKRDALEQGITDIADETAQQKAELDEVADTRIAPLEQERDSLVGII